MLRQSHTESSSGWLFVDLTRPRALPSIFIANMFGRSRIVSAADFNDENEALVETIA